MEEYNKIGNLFDRKTIEKLSKEEVLELINLESNYGTRLINKLREYPNLERETNDKVIQKLTTDQLEGILMYEYLEETVDFTNSELIYLNGIFGIEYKTVMKLDFNLENLLIEEIQKSSGNQKDEKDKKDNIVVKKLEDEEYICILGPNKKLQEYQLSNTHIMFIFKENNFILINFEDIYMPYDERFINVQKDVVEKLQMGQSYLEKVEESIDIELVEENKNDKWIWAMMQNCRYYTQNNMIEKLDKIKEIKQYIEQFNNKKNKSNLRTLEQSIKKLTKILEAKENNEKNILQEEIEQEQEEKEEAKVNIIDIFEEEKIKEENFINPQKNKIQELVDYCSKYNMSNIIFSGIFNKMVIANEYMEYLDEIIMCFEMFEAGEIDLKTLKIEIKDLTKINKTEIVIEDNKVKNNKSQENKNIKAPNSKIYGQYSSELSANNRIKFILDNFEIEEILIGKSKDLKGRCFFKIKDEEYIIGEIFFKTSKDEKMEESYGNSTWIIPKENFIYENDKIKIEKKKMKRVNHSKNGYYRNLIIRSRQIFQNPNPKLEKKEELVESNLAKIKTLNEIDELITILNELTNKDEITKLNKMLKEKEQEISK